MNFRIKQILSYYPSDNPGTKNNIARILMSGRLTGSGYMLILPVDQGFEHGPARSFAMNPATYDPRYHAQLAVDAGLSAYAAPIGMLESIADEFTASIPLILKANSAHSLGSAGLPADQAITSTVKDALRLGCVAIGFTIYPGSPCALSMIEEVREIALEAKAHGLAIVIWSYPRGPNISKSGETALDIIAYAAHIAALLGAHIIKVKLPTANIELNENKPVYSKYCEYNTAAERIAHIVQSCFAGRRLVVFSGGATKEDSELYKEITAIKIGGGNGSIIGRNTFQRPRAKALDMLSKVIDIYLSS